MQPGHEQLRDWIGRRYPLSQRPQRDAAEYLGVHESTLCAILAQRRALGLKLGVHFQRYTGIPVEAWVPSEVDISDDSVVQSAH